MRVPVGAPTTSHLPTTRVFEKPPSEDLPSFQGAVNLAFCCFRYSCGAQTRKKDGKDHRYFSIVENRRLPGDRTVQRTVLYLGEINDQQQAAWRKTLEVFDEEQQEYASLSLFPDDREIPADAVDSLT